MGMLAEARLRRASGTRWTRRDGYWRGLPCGQAVRHRAPTGSAEHRRSPVQARPEHLVVEAIRTYPAMVIRVDELADQLGVDPGDVRVILDQEGIAAAGGVLDGDEADYVRQALSSEERALLRSRR